MKQIRNTPAKATRIVATVSDMWPPPRLTRAVVRLRAGPSQWLKGLQTFLISNGCSGQYDAVSASACRACRALIDRGEMSRYNEANAGIMFRCNYRFNENIDLGAITLEVLNLCKRSSPPSARINRGRPLLASDGPTTTPVLPSFKSKNRRSGLSETAFP
jgi:hypothetical protein